VERRLQPLLDRVLETYTFAKDKTLSMGQPYYVKSRDGALYVRATVAGTVVSIKLGMYEKTDRLKLAALTAFSSASKVVADYMNPVVVRVVSMYEAISAHLLKVFGPYLAQAQESVSYGRAKIQNVAVAIKVKTGAAYGRAAVWPASCYVTIRDGFVYVQGKVGDKVVLIKVQLSELLERVKDIVLSARDETRARILALTTSARSAAGQKNVQVTAASAAGGAVAMGAGGLLAGGAVGAACGLPLALFTFGLSIPIGAAIGGGAGLCAGSAAGGAVGGAAGRKVYSERESIADGYTIAMNKAGNCKSLMAEHTAALRVRLVGGTGGTA